MADGSQVEPPAPAGFVPPPAIPGVPHHPLLAPGASIDRVGLLLTARVNALHAAVAEAAVAAAQSAGPASLEQVDLARRYLLHRAGHLEAWLLRANPDPALPIAGGLPDVEG